MAYMTWQQLAKIFLCSSLLVYGLGVPVANLLFFWAAPGLLSAFRLFYFGTYLPHRPPSGSASEAMPWEKSASSDDARLVSFLKVYHFDLHYEHHRWPLAPWWQLPSCKQITNAEKAVVAAAAQTGAEQQNAAGQQGAAAPAARARARR